MNKETIKFLKDRAIGRLSYWYLASPYSKWDAGQEDAFERAADYAAILIRRGIPVFCPIAHSHSIAKIGPLDGLSHELWMTQDWPLVRASCGIIICPMFGWNESLGVVQEIQWADKLGLPVMLWEYRSDREVVTQLLPHNLADYGVML